MGFWAKTADKLQRSLRDVCIVHPRVSATHSACIMPGGYEKVGMPRTVGRYNDISVKGFLGQWGLDRTEKPEAIGLYLINSAVVFHTV